MEVGDFQFGFEIDLIIVLRAQTIARFHAVLAHHDDRRLDRGQAGEDQVEKYVRIRIEGAPQSGTVLMLIQTNKTNANEPIKVQLPPKVATRSAVR